MPLWLLLLVLAAVTYRVTRFVILDTLLDEPRDRLMDWLEQPHNGAPPSLWKRKVHELLSCPFCVSIWVAAGALALTRWLVIDSIPAPIWNWLAVATGAVVIYAYVDAED